MAGLVYIYFKTNAVEDGNPVRENNDADLALGAVHLDNIPNNRPGGGRVCDVEHRRDAVYGWLTVLPPTLDSI